jgi:UDP-N-acetylmuramoylalanine--D-glutamate ligase
MSMETWKDKRVVILGAARQGLALARYLVRQGATVTLSDLRPEEKMGAALAAMQGLPVAWALGGHPLSLLDGADLLCVSGGVPLTIPIVQEALARGIPLSNDSQIFFEAVPCPVIGITGSAGKTTTTSLVGRMALAEVRKPRKAWVGGNIGNPLVDQLDEIQPEDVVVLELSSFQLEIMTRSPQIAAVLNVTPNHLDRHGTLEAYTAAKARILEFQRPGDTAVLNREDPGSWNLRHLARARVISFGCSRPEGEFTGACCQEDRLYWCENGEDYPLLPRSEILLRGDHNLSNVLAAAAIARAAGFSLESIREGVRGFRGVDHRLEHVRTWKGVQWINDSIATAPERTSAALRSFDEPLVLLLGGRDKNLPWEDLAAQIRSRVDHVIVFGEAAGKILQALGSPHAGERPFSITRCAGLEQAVSAAAEVAEPGDVVLFSPGGTSFDEFTDFEERGEAFRRWVNRLS